MKNEETKTKIRPLSRTDFRFGAGGRGRTGTVSLPLDFESSTSANSITPASALHFGNKSIIHKIRNLSTSQGVFRHKFLYYFKQCSSFGHFPVFSKDKMFSIVVFAMLLSASVVRYAWCEVTSTFGIVISRASVSSSTI